MINICRKSFFYEQLKLGKGSFFEVPFINSNVLQTKVASFNCSHFELGNPHATKYILAGYCTGGYITMVTLPSMWSYY